MRKTRILFMFSTIAIFIICGFIMISPDPSGVIFKRKLQTVTEQQRVYASRKDANEIKLNKRHRGIVKSRNSNVYMYSAIQTFVNDFGPKKRETHSTKEPTKTQMSKIVVSGWESNEKQSLNFICCHMMKNGSVIQIPSSEKTDSLNFIRTEKLRAKHYTCRIINNSSITQLISIELSGSFCPIDKKYYTVVETVFPNSTLQQNNRNKTIAVCTKLAYGSLNARRLIEWFEVHRLFGVDKVFSYLYKLNSAAREVFEYYENLGMAETREFHLADKKSVTREAGFESKQYWNDEQVTLYDCQERTRNYDYVAVVDTDEFMIPSINVFKNAWKIFLNKMFQKPDTAGFLFPVSVHVTTWGQSMPNHFLFIGQYNNCTLPWYDREKGIHMPSRVQSGSVSTHNFVPLPGYKQENVDGELASLHHFRRCREQWLKPRSVQDMKEGNTKLYYSQNARECYDFRRFSSKIIKRVADAVQESVYRVINEIGV